MKTRIICTAVLSLMLECAAHAQVTNYYDGVTLELTNITYIGATNSYDQFSLVNGGVLSDTNSYDVFVGYAVGADNNSVTVDGNGTFWDQSSGGGLYVGNYGSGNSLTISGGAKMSAATELGWQAGANRNQMVVTGNGTFLTNTFDLEIGEAGSGNMMTISDGGVVDSHLRVCEAGLNPGSDNNRVLVTGNGSSWTNVGYLIIGNSGNHNSMVISNGAVVVSSEGVVGQAAIGGHFGSNNWVIITGSGSVWTNTGGGFTVGYVDDNFGNSVIVSNGGGLFSSSSSMYGVSNTVSVTGNGSVWNAGTLNLGVSTATGGGNSLVVSDGAFVSTIETYIGTGNIFNNNASLSDYNQIVVSGSGSVWTNSDQIHVGDTGSGNSLTISNGGVVQSANQFVIGANRCVFANAAASNNVVSVSSGTLIVTNTGGNGTLAVGATGAGANSLILNDGSVTANVLEVYSNSILTGCGTINGRVIIDAGGMVLAGCGGNLNFTGNVTNNGTMRATNGSVLNVSGLMGNNGIIDAINGAANFSGGFINNGNFLTASNLLVSSVGFSGPDALIQIPSAAGHTYQLQSTASLTPPHWTNTAASQAGTGGVLTFTNSSALTAEDNCFYRVTVTTP